MKKDDLIVGCRDLEVHIRNQLGLQNKPLLENSGKKFDPNGAVAAIIEALWRKLQKK